MNDYSTVDFIVDYLLTEGSNIHSRKELCKLFEADERTIREAFYIIKDMGRIVLNDGDTYTIITDDNIDENYHEVIRQLKSDYRKWRKLVTRFHKQNKSLPQKYQLNIEGDKING